MRTVALITWWAVQSAATDLARGWRYLTGRCSCAHCDQRCRP